MDFESIGNILSLHRGYDLTTKEMNDGTIPVAGSNGVIGFHDTSLVDSPAITVGRSGSVGKVHYYDTPIWPHNTSLYVDDFKGNNPMYIYYLLRLLDLEKLCDNSVVPSLNRNFVYPLKVPFIKGEKRQEKTIKILKIIDELIGLKRKENTILESLAKQIYDYWFVQFDFPNDEGKPYKSSGGKMVWNETLKREIPDGWSEAPLSSISSVENGATPSTLEEDNYGGKIGWITPKDLSNKRAKFFAKGERSITQKGYDSCSTTLLPAGSILMSSRAPIGLVAIASDEVCTNQGFKNIVPNEINDRFFLFYYIKKYMPFIEAMGNGTTFKEVSKDSLLSFPIMKVNNTNVYRKWVQIAKNIFEKQKKLEMETDELQSLRDYLLPLLMNGQVTIKD